MIKVLLLLSCFFLVLVRALPLPTEHVKNKPGNLVAPATGEIEELQAEETAYRGGGRWKGYNGWNGGYRGGYRGYRKGWRRGYHHW
ncbi:hypothetical protein JTB14_007886 [Gonioctena quinquepunctata]|nr:hypothetical protein JTB14_007886 [Gonioctena quinquepunctata]